MSNPTPVQLLAFIQDTFDTDELETLCFQLYVPYDDLAGQTRVAKARELIEFMQRVGRTDDLVATLILERPQAWANQFGTDQLDTANRASKAKPLPRNPKQIFLSHAHQDSDVAQRLAADLRRSKYEVWIAPESISPGERWVDAINRALKESGVFLLISTPHAVESQWVQDETSYAIELAMKERISFMVLDMADADIPPMWTVRQHISFRNGYDAGLIALRTALKSKTASQLSAAAADSTQSKVQGQEIVSTGEESTPSGQAIASPIQEGGKAKVDEGLDVSRTEESDKQRAIGSVLGRLKAAPSQSKFLYGGFALLLLILAVFGTINSGLLDDLIYPSRPEPGEMETLAADTGTALSMLALPTREPAGETRTITLPTGIEVEQVAVPAGTFVMGAEWAEPGDVSPAHEVELDEYWIDRTEVTVRQYYSCVEAGTCDPPPVGNDFDTNALADYPVVWVSWFDANRFCQWAGGRLPTEAEWENAAKGLEALTYPYGGELPIALANYNSQIGDSAPVGSYPTGASWVGAYDMLGNVWEWVADWYSVDYYANSPQQNPSGPEQGDQRVLRGGAFGDDGYHTNSVFRYHGTPDDRTIEFGFRCVSDETSPAVSEVVNVVGDHILVPAGSFEMGNADGDEDEMPVHSVSLDSYLIDRTEVTNAQFESFVQETGHETLGETEGGGWSYDGTDWAYIEGANWRHPVGPESDISELADHPVVLVSWEDAAAYCQWKGGNLPTEAQWEFAARGPENSIWPWGNEFDQENLNYCDQNCPFDMPNQDYDDGYEFSAPVGTYPDGESWMGAVDMIGNVWEWVRDWYGEDYYQHSEELNPTGPATGTIKVVRGGAWDLAGDSVVAADRSAYDPQDHDLNLGFRCVQELD